MTVSMRLTLSKWALGFAITAAMYCTLALFFSVMGDPYPGMSPAEMARDKQAKDATSVWFCAAWLVVFGVAIFMRWQKWLWQNERKVTQMQAQVRK